MQKYNKQLRKPWSTAIIMFLSTIKISLDNYRCTNHKGVTSQISDDGTLVFVYYQRGNRDRKFQRFALDLGYLNDKRYGLLTSIRRNSEYLVSRFASKGYLTERVDKNQFFKLVTQHANLDPIHYGIIKLIIDDLILSKEVQLQLIQKSRSQARKYVMNAIQDSISKLLVKYAWTTTKTGRIRKYAKTSTDVR